MIEFRNEEIERLQERVARELGFNLVGHKLELYGVPTRSQTPAQMTMTQPKKIFVKTFGCQMNVYDSERMTELLAPHGYAETEAMEDADLILLNTCHIREKAAEKVYSDLGRIRQVKAARASAGQGHHRRGGRLRRPGRGRRDRAPRAGRRSGGRAAELSPLGELVARAGSQSGASIVETGFPEEDKFAPLPERAPRQGA